MRRNQTMMHGKIAPGYRLPEETAVGGVALRVRDMDRSLDFYHSFLGFEIQEHSSARAQLGAGGKTLIELHAGAAQARSQRRLGLYHFAILLPDRKSLGQCLGHLLEGGVHPGAADHLVSEALYIQDPDGLGIEIYRDRPRDEWRVVGQQLAMASDPLDFQNLLDAAEGRIWQGMPAGTRMGHVHLHVGDLEQARAFYHEALGLDLVVWSYPGALFLSAGGYHHHLGVNTWAGATATPSPEEEAQLLWWDLALPSRVAINEAVSSLAGAGYAVPADEVGRVLVADPWGTKVRLAPSLD